jgi:hypothetical protein
MASTNPLTYNDFISQICDLAVMKTQVVSGVVQAVSDQFNTLIPQMLNYAELRMQRDIDFLCSEITRSGYNYTAGDNRISIPVDDFVTVQTLQSIVAGVPIPMVPVSKEFLQNLYPSGDGAGVPKYFAPVGGDLAGGLVSNNFIVGPFPNTSYAFAVTGTQRLPSLFKYATPSDAAVKTTFISTYLPDLLLMASMIYVSGFQRNFGRQGDDPQMSVSYESQYQTLLKTALVEEARKKFWGPAWSAESPSTIATPSR